MTEGDECNCRRAATLREEYQEEVYECIEIDRAIEHLEKCARPQLRC